MADIYYKIQIESIFLTQTGLTDGKLCYLEVSGVKDLLFSFTRTTDTRNDGSDGVQTFSWTDGKPIDILIRSLPRQVGLDLVDLFEDSMLNQTLVTVIGGEATTPDFNVECKYLDFQFKDMSRNNWENCLIKLVTATLG